MTDSAPALELPLPELLERLNVGQDIPLTTSRVRVTHVSLVGETPEERRSRRRQQRAHPRGPTRPGAGLELTIEAGVAGGPVECWVFRMPVEADLLGPDVLPQAFVAVVRANLDEWWLTRHTAPALAARGRRLA